MSSAPWALSTLALLLTYCFPAFAQQLPAPPVRLGVISPFTGVFAAYGDHIKRGIQIAQDDLKRRGIETEIFYEDACLPVDARSAVSKLLSADRIQALVGSYCVVGMMPAVPLFEGAHVIAFHTSVVPQEMLDAGQYIFTTNARIRDEAAKLAGYAFRERGARTAGVLFVTTQWGEEYQRHFTKRFVELGGKITGSETVAIGPSDLRAELTRLRSGKPDVLLFIHVGATLANALVQARQLGLRQPLSTVNEAEEPEILQTAGRSAEGIEFFAPEPEVQSATMKDFGAKFLQQFRREPHPLSRHSYDATMLAASVLSECKGNGECAKAKLYEVKDYEGATGVFSIESDGGTKRDFVLKTVRDGHVSKIRASSSGS